MDPELIHKRGMSLDRARFNLADPILIEEYNEYQRSLQNPDEYFTKLAADNEQVQETISKNPNLSKVAVLASLAIDQFTGPTHLQNSILRKIYSGELVAAGYVLPRTHESKPVIPNRDVWAGKINWKKSEVVGNGLHYTGICVARKADIEALEVAQLPKPTEPPKAPGRPGVEREIKWALRELDELGQIDFEAPRSHCYPLVRAYLAEKLPERVEAHGKTSDKTLERHTKSYFDERKAQLIRQKSDPTKL